MLLASLPYGLLCTTVLMGKHIDKIPYDEPLGIRTLPVIFGEARARALTLAMMVGFYLLVVAAVLAKAMPWPALLVVVGAAAAGQGVAVLPPPAARRAAGQFPGVAAVVRGVWPGCTCAKPARCWWLGLAIAALLQSDLLGYLGDFSHVYWQMSGSPGRLVALHQRELADLRDVALEEVRASDQVAHVAVVDLVGGRRDGLVAGGFQLLRPGVERPDVVRRSSSAALDRKPCVAASIR